MAQDGDTITYTFSDGTSVDEDVSNVNEMTIEYCDGAGGEDSVGARTAAPGGRVENTIVDISSYDTVYFFVGGSEGAGRYEGGSGNRDAGGSTEVSFENTDSSDSDDEPFIVGSGGGGGGSNEINGSYYGGPGGGRGGTGGDGEDYDGGDGEGVDPPLGGDGGEAPGTTEDATAGYGSVASIPEIKQTGTTEQGGGSETFDNGEIKVSYEQTLSPPDPPSNLTAEVQ